MLHTQPVAAPPLLLPDSTTDDADLRSLPKKRAETWTQEEILALITFRRELDSLFNTSKSNKHLWEQISGRMRDRGFDRSPTMCTDKWRNLLKEFKKARSQVKGGGGGNGKMAWYKEIDELLKRRGKGGGGGGGGGGLSVGVGVGAKVDDSFVQFADKGIHASSSQVA